VVPTYDHFCSQWRAATLPNQLSVNVTSSRQWTVWSTDVCCANSMAFSQLQIIS